MKKISFGTADSDVKNAAFIALYARDYQPWINTLSLSEEQRQTKVPAILLLNRWDGRVGFAGGEVDGDETLAQAAIREAKEEINLVLNECDIEPICSHEFAIGKGKSLRTHLFSKECSAYELFEIQKETLVNGDDYGSEIMGSNMILVGDFGRGKGFPTFISSPMATSVREELIELILSKNLVSRGELENMVKLSGFDLEELVLNIN